MCPSALITCSLAPGPSFGLHPSSSSSKDVCVYYFTLSCCLGINGALIVFLASLRSWDPTSIWRHTEWIKAYVEGRRSWVGSMHKPTESAYVMIGLAQQKRNGGLKGSPHLEYWCLWICCCLSVSSPLLSALSSDLLQFIGHFPLPWPSDSCYFKLNSDNLIA